MRDKPHLRIALDLIIQINDMQDIEKLSLILVQTLDLYIKNRIRIDFDVVMFQNISGEAFLVGALDRGKLLPLILVIDKRVKFLHLRKICHPLRSDQTAHPCCQALIAVEQETPLGDTVGLVVELIRLQIIEIAQSLFLQNLGVEPCHAVDRE